MTLNVPETVHVIVSMDYEIQRYATVGLVFIGAMLVALFGIWIALTK